MPDNANRKIIAVFYKTARRLTSITGIRFDVDHMTPFRQNGLHHQSNLLVIPATLNKRKQNRTIEQIIDLPDFRNTFLADLYRSQLNRPTVS